MTTTTSQYTVTRFNWAFKCEEFVQPDGVNFTLHTDKAYTTDDFEVALALANHITKTNRVMGIVQAYVTTI